MRLVVTKNTVLVIIGKERIPLVTLDSTAQAMRALKWTRKHDTVIEGASKLLDYCKGKGLRPKGRAIGKKQCAGLAGMKANYSK
jgi:hypothetical protein